MRTTFTMHLNDRLVFKHFGGRPEIIGVVAHWLPKYLDDKKRVSTRMISFRKLKPTLYEITLEPEYKEATQLWLVDNCRPKPPKQKWRKRRKGAQRWYAHARPLG